MSTTDDSLPADTSESSASDNTITSGARAEANILEQVASAIILIFLILTSVIAIAEIAGRISLSARIDSAIAEITKNMAQRTQVAEPERIITIPPPELRQPQSLPNAPSASEQASGKLERIPLSPSAEGPASRPAPSARPETPPIVLENSLEKLSILYLAKEIVAQIESIGEQGSFTRSYVESLLLSRFYRFQEDTPRLGDNGAGYIFRLFANFGSDMILALVVVFAGGIGAVISGIRKNEFSLFRDLSLGISAGFISYLAIRGGKSVLLIEHSGREFLMNPYGCAFFGLLAGLFTDRAYGVLSDVVDALIKRIKDATK